jgi:hypothetical protein
MHAYTPSPHVQGLPDPTVTLLALLSILYDHHLRPRRLHSALSEVWTASGATAGKQRSPCLEKRVHDQPISRIADSHGSHFLKSLFLVTALFVLSGATACGGGSSTATAPPGGGGGGGGGGTGGSGQSATLFGMHINRQTTPWPSVPVGGLRLWDTSAQWALVNTAQGQYDWTKFDPWLAEAQANKADVLYVLGRTPNWASSNPTDATCSYATLGGGTGQCWPPVDVNPDGTGTDAIWIAWVSAVVQHSKSSTTAHISYYEIWNEWTVPHFWKGTVAQLARMSQDAYCVIKGTPANGKCNSSSTFPSGTALDTTAMVLTPSAVGGHSDLASVANNTKTFLQADGGPFFDVIGFHCYVGLPTAGPPFPMPEDVNTLIDNLNSALGSSASQTQGKPLFCTEGGWSNAVTEGFLDPDLQAAFLARYYLLQQSKGVARVYWYRWDNPAPDMGDLWNPVTGISKAGTAYGEVYKWLVGATLSSPCSMAGTVWTCAYTRASGYQAFAVWDGNTAASCYTVGTPTCSTFTIPTSVTYTEYRDLASNVTALNGATTVAIGAKPILLETGALP